MIRSVFAAAAIIGMAIATPARCQSKDQLRALALVDRPATALVPMITVKGDDLDPVISISTYGVTAITNKGLLASTTVENSWLRAFINKKTGNVIAQVYHTLHYSGAAFDSFDRATYEGPEGVEEATVTQVGHDVSCGRYGCTFYEDLTFPVSLDVLRKAAKKYDPSSPRSGIHYRLFGQSGRNVDEGIPINEIVAFLEVIDREAAKLPKH